MIISSFFLLTAFSKEKTEVKENSKVREPATSPVAIQVDDFVLEVAALLGKAGEDLAKDKQKLDTFADKTIEKVLFFNKKENRDKLYRPEDYAMCLYDLTKNPDFSKALRDVVMKKVLLHPQKKILEKIISEGEEAYKGNG